MTATASSWSLLTFSAEGCVRLVYWWFCWTSIWLMKWVLLVGLTPTWIHLFRMIVFMVYKAEGHQMTGQGRVYLSVVNKCFFDVLISKRLELRANLKWRLVLFVFKNVEKSLFFLTVPRWVLINIFTGYTYYIIANLRKKERNIIYFDFILRVLNLFL